MSHLSFGTARSKSAAQTSSDIEFTVKMHDLPSPLLFEGFPPDKKSGNGQAFFVWSISRLTARYVLKLNASDVKSDKNRKNGLYAYNQPVGS